MTPLETLLQNYPQLAVCQNDIQNAIQLIGDCFAQNGTLFTCGNGGSSADADHIAGEFLKGFCKKRPADDKTMDALRRYAGEEDGLLLGTKLQCGLRCIPLGDFSSLLSAVRNDLDGQMDYAQALFALGRPGDVLLGISTSGNARNVKLATAVAKTLGMKVIGLTGEKGGLLAQNADIAIRVPAQETFRIQEFHLPVYHTICLCVENRFFDR